MWLQAPFKNIHWSIDASILMPFWSHSFDICVDVQSHMTTSHWLLLNGWRNQNEKVVSVIDAKHFWCQNYNFNVPLIDTSDWKHLQTDPKLKYCFNFAKHSWNRSFTQTSCSSLTVTAFSLRVDVVVVKFLSLFGSFIFTLTGADLNSPQVSISRVSLSTINSCLSGKKYILNFTINSSFCVFKRRH